MMESLERLHELKFKTKLQYFQELNRLDINYSHYIDSILQQQKWIKRKFQHKHKIILQQIDKKIQSLTTEIVEKNSISINTNTDCHTILTEKSIDIDINIPIKPELEPVLGNHDQGYQDTNPDCYDDHDTDHEQSLLTVNNSPIKSSEKSNDKSNDKNDDKSDGQPQLKTIDHDHDTEFEKCNKATGIYHTRNKNLSASTISADNSLATFAKKQNININATVNNQISCNLNSISDAGDGVSVYRQSPDAMILDSGDGGGSGDSGEQHIQGNSKKKRMADSINCKQKKRHQLQCYQRVMENGVAKYRCAFSDCSKVYQSARSAQLHYVGAHTTQHQCDICKSCCSSKYQLKRHKRSHTGEKPFMCTYQGCNKSYTRKEHLTIHMRYHTGEKPYPCNYCGKTFVSNNQRNEHERIHTGQRPYQCRYNQCNKRFIQSSHRNTHELTHKK